jgi:hypothetical protein
METTGPETVGWRANLNYKKWFNLHEKIIFMKIVDFKRN